MAVGLALMVAAALAAVAIGLAGGISLLSRRRAAAPLDRSPHTEPDQDPS